MIETVIAVLVLALPVLTTAVVSWIAIRRTRSEPRRLSNAYWLLIAAIMVLGLVLIVVPHSNMILLPVMFVLVLSPILVLVLAAFLILNGVELLRRERWGLAHLLSLLAGLGMAVLIIAAVPVVLAGELWLTSGYLVVVLASSYLGFQFLAFLGYSLLYRRIVKNRPASWVVVLGSGLGADGRVPPLLAARVQTGLDECRRRGAEKLIMSGGQGEDEPVSEAAAMAAWAVEHGAQESMLQLEDRSRSTEQNLRYTAELVPTGGPETLTRPGLIVTSNYHTMRAAILARKVGLPAHACGAPTAGYYWPSAMLREFIAILADRPVLHLVLTALVAVPMPLLIAVVGG